MTRRLTATALLPLAPTCGHHVCAHRCNAYCSGATHATVVAAEWPSSRGERPHEAKLSRLQASLSSCACTANIVVTILRPIAEVGACYPDLPSEKGQYFLCLYHREETP